jgi:hypothetical protein
VLRGVRASVPGLANRHALCAGLRDCESKMASKTVRDHACTVEQQNEANASTAQLDLTRATLVAGSDRGSLTC